MKKLLFSTVLTAISVLSYGQAFVNGELDGPVGISSYPTNWGPVPETFVFSFASGPIQATSDVCNATGPNVGGGIAGVPHSGATMVTGLQGTSGSMYWHEGIQQQVNGFTVGCTYDVTFWQSVCQQSNAQDPTGSWSMFFDNTLAGTSAASTTTLAYNDVNLVWEQRTISFTATATSHMIRFLPQDDDGDQFMGAANGGVRMAIDLISISGGGVAPSITAAGPFCTAQAPVNLVGTPPGGTWGGNGITNTTTGTFDPGVAGVGSHTITYDVTGGCGVGQATTVIDVTASADASWTSPGSVCQGSGTIDLNTLVTGTAGGTWSGPGVTGSTFDPSGQSGSINITYDVGTAPCDDSNTQSITVTTNASAAWTPPVGLCSSSAQVDLNTLITGTTGGTWSGTGVTGNMFDPSAGTQTVTYTVGTAPCDDMSAQTITIVPASDATWTNPGPLCQADGPINLDLQVTGTAGGTWSGTGVTGNTFDPAGLSGNITVTYAVGTAPCDDILALDINVITLADPNWTIPTNLCSSSPQVDLNAQITGTTGGTWSGTGVTGNMFDPSVGTQSVTYTVGSGTCQQVLTQTITVGNVFDPSWTTLTMCVSDAPVNMDGQITGDMGGTWSGTGMSGSVFDPFFGTQSITYTVGTGPCALSSTQTVTVIDPQVTALSTPISCFGANDGTTTANVTGTTGSETYLWNPSGQTTSTATGLGPGQYQVTITDGTCTATDTITVVEPPRIFLSMQGTNGCSPSLGAANVDATGGVGGFSYAWTPSGQTAQTAIQLDSAMHTVVVTDANGCSETDSVLVQILPPPTISTINDTTIIYPNCIKLPATGGVSYTWSPNDDMDCDTCVAPEVCPMYATQYCVTGTDANGCVNSDCVLINVEIICNEVFVPSAFSPNNDGENDLECVYSDCLENFTFTIYNRWGEKVFETQNESICWDGTWKGKELNSAVFVYVLDGYLINGEHINQKGNISLIR